MASFQREKINLIDASHERNRGRVNKADTKCHLGSLERKFNFGVLGAVVTREKMKIAAGRIQARVS
jgi:hypothetical protein